jgi:hypothetical protein
VCVCVCVCVCVHVYPVVFTRISCDKLHKFSKELCAVRKRIEKGGAGSENHYPCFLIKYLHIINVQAMLCLQPDSNQDVYACDVLLP